MNFKELMQGVRSVVDFSAFQIRDDDPEIHHANKVKGKPFAIAVIGHQHIKYAMAQFRGKKGWLGKPTSAFCENFLTADIDAPWVVEMLSELKGNRTILLGLNIPFSNIKIYEKNYKLKDIQRLLDSKLELEVGKTFERQTKYFLHSVLDQHCLNGVERDKILKPIEKFRKWGFSVVGAFHYPSALLSRISREDLDWENPCILVMYYQRMLFFMGWNRREVLLLRSKLISEGARNAPGTRPILAAIQKEIDLTQSFIEGKTGKPVTSIYVYSDRQDQAFSGIEGLYKNTKVIQWPVNGCEFESQPYPDLDLSTVIERM